MPAILVRRPHLLMVVHTVAIFGITIRRNGETVHVNQDQVLQQSEELRQELKISASDWLDILTEFQTLISNCPPPSANAVAPKKVVRKNVAPTDLMAALKASLGQ